MSICFIPKFIKSLIFPLKALSISFAKSGLTLIAVEGGNDIAVCRLGSWGLVVLMPLPHAYKLNLVHPDT